MLRLPYWCKEASLSSHTHTGVVMGAQRCKCTWLQGSQTNQVQPLDVDKIQREEWRWNKKGIYFSEANTEVKGCLQSAENTTKFI